MPTPDFRDVGAIKANVKLLDVAVRTLLSRATAGSSGATYDALDNEQLVAEVHRLCAAIAAQVDELAPWPDSRGGARP